MNNKDRSKRPKAVQPNLTNVPESLRSVHQWVLWRYDWSVKSGQWAKVPYSATGTRASSTDSTTWDTFQSCVLASQQAKASYDGLGFVFSPSTPYVGVDLDNCVLDNAGTLELTPLAVDLVDKLATYTELSPSQTGLHLIGTADNIQAAKGTWQGAEIEVYTKDRYFTFTGQSWQDEPLSVTDIDTEVKDLAKKIRGEATEKSATITVARRLEMALRDGKTKSLFEGDISDYNNDRSRADLALCSKLAYFSGGTAAVLDEMFRKSELFRDKWDERHGSDTYGNMTMTKALASQTTFLGSKFQQSPAVATEESRKLRRHTIKSLWDQAMEFRESGDAKGVHPGWDELEKYYRPTLGSLTVLVGEPGSGKSTWIDALAYNLAKRHGWRTTMASFESLPIQRHILNLCQIHLQKPTFTFVNGCATKLEMEKARDEIGEWFNFIMPDDDELDMDSILNYVEDDIREYDIKGFVLDPFTEVSLKLTGVNEVKAIEQSLKRLQQFTRNRSIHTWLLAHPTKSGDTYKKEGETMRPTLYSAAGAAHFRNKALALDTKIPTPSGWTTMGEVEVGNTLFDSKGNPCTVTNVTEVIKNASCYNMRFKNGAEVVADAGHLWVTNDLSSRRSNNKSLKYGYKTKPYSKIRTTENIAATVQTKDGNANHRVSVAGSLTLPERDLLIPPYTLGAWLGDGRKYDGQFTSIDVDVINRIRQDKYIVNQHSEQKSWGIRSLKVQLRELGLIHNKHIPKEYLRGSYEQRLDLVKGLMDTDGCAEKDTGWCIFTNTNKAIASGLFELLGTLGIKASTVGSRATLNGEDYGIVYTVKFTTGIEVFNLQYKLERQRKAINKITQWHSIISSVPIESVLVKCIEVDSPDHMFLITEHFIPTHNCDFGMVIHRGDNDLVDLYIDKVRNDSTGSRGKVSFNYIPDRREYEGIKEDTW